MSDAEKKKREDEAVIKKLEMLANLRKRHEWSVVSQHEADTEEAAEDTLDAEAERSASDSDKSQ